MTVATLAALAALAAWRAARTEGLYHWCAQAVQLLATILLLVVAFEGDTMAKKKTGAVAEKSNGVDASALLAKAAALFGNEKYKEAREAYQAAADAGADQLLCAHAIANCDFELRDDKRLADDCAALHSIPGGEGRARFWLGQMHRRNKEYAAARNDLELAVRHGYLVANGSLAQLAAEGR